MEGWYRKEILKNFLQQTQKICLAYSIQGCEALKPDKYEVSHQGYDNQYVNAGQDRLLPVDIMRESWRKKELLENYVISF